MEDTEYTFRSVVWRDADGQLMLLWPHRGYASPIADPTGVYTDLPEESMDVVEVRTNQGDELKFDMRSLYKMSWVKPPKGLTINSDSQLEEWPSKAHEVIEFVMQTHDRAVKFMQIVHEDPKE